MAIGEDKKQPDPEENRENVFSPRFKSVAAMAGWDEEAILVASLVVEDTPDQNKHKKRSDLHFKTPPSTNSRRKRRLPRRSPISIPIPALDLDETETAKKESEQNKVVDDEEKKETGGNELISQDSAVSCSSPALPSCMDKLREELSCAICLEICFEPSTTPCGHSFCKKCLRSAADKCGKRCPKCRQLVSNGRSCNVNTILWNTIQLLFPQEIEARKVAGAFSREAVGESQIRTSASSGSRRDARERRRVLLSNQGDNNASLAERLQREDLGRLVVRDGITTRRRREATRPSQDQDAALALRLQREEFMVAFRREDTRGLSSNSLALARVNLRAMASRAINIRARGRPL